MFKPCAVVRFHLRTRKDSEDNSTCRLNVIFFSYSSDSIFPILQSRWIEEMSNQYRMNFIEGRSRRPLLLRTTHNSTEKRIWQHQIYVSLKQVDAFIGSYSIYVLCRIVRTTNERNLLINSVFLLLKRFGINIKILFDSGKYC